MDLENTILEKDLIEIHSQSSIESKLKNKTLIITGCAGFLGFYFLQYFIKFRKELGLKRIIGLDNLYSSKPFWLDRLVTDYPDIFEFVQFDISKDKISSIDVSKEANFIIHMASIASPSFYRRFPLETVDANIWGLRSILDFYKDSDNLEGILFFSSSEIYGDPESNNIPTSENYRGNVSCTGPRACYDESKRFGETLCQIFAEKHDMPITVARPFNNYGPGLNIEDKRLPADFAKCVLEDRDIIIFSDGTPTRTFCYITDAIVGYIRCLLYGRYDFFNIGNDSPEISVLEFSNYFVDTAKRIFNYKGKVRLKQSKDPKYLIDNPIRRCPDLSKAKRLLSYSPQVEIEDGIYRYLKFLHFELKNSI